jgi:hypothetical protein
MKRRHFLGFGAGGALRAAPAPETAAGSTLLSLDGEWLLAIDPQNAGRSRQWYAGALPEAKRVVVPAIIQEAFPAYHGVAWCAREFKAPARPYPQGPYLLRFWAVDYLAEVWVNGVHVGVHEGGETPFVLDATEAIRPDATNRIVVRVLNPSNDPIDGLVLKDTPHRNKSIPYRPGNSFDTGGITEPVELLLAPAVRIEDIYARPDWQTGKIRVQVKLRNAAHKPARARLELTAAAVGSGQLLAFARLQHAAAPGETTVDAELLIDSPRLWDLSNPNLYQITVRAAAEPGSFDQSTVRCGFQDFRVVDGFFRLNGRRVFLRSTHTGNHCPIGQVIAPRQAPDLLRRDLLFAKSSGFNTVRFISGIAHPYQLDLCDEIGLMVYQECYAGWLLGDSPEMPRRFDLSVREMILRDRNHPSVTIWGLLNETGDGPVFRHAVAALPLVRSLDDTRLVLLGSGRFDRQLSIGSLSNPGSREWEYQWGAEANGAPAVADWNRTVAPYVDGAGDVHIYPGVPQTPEVNKLLRTIAHDSRPVFLSEYGIGSLLDAVHEARMYEQAGTPPEVEDFALIRSMADRLQADWQRFGMDGVYPFPEDMLRDSQRLMARQRALGFDLVRSNPRVCGFNVTGMLDHALTGEGFWRFWREWKPGIVDVLQDGWAPLRWCLFADPMHAWAGRTVKLEAVLANEDVLRPGGYPVRFRLSGPAGVVWERQATAHIAAGQNGPLAMPVLEEEVRLDGPAGVYELVADMERGGAPLNRRLQFHVSDPAALPRLNHQVALWGISENARHWLATHGITAAPYEDERTRVLLVGDVSGSEDAARWQSVIERMNAGSVAVFLSPLTFRRGQDPVGWLPLTNKGRCYRFNDWLYHKECVAKAHPVFAGLQPRGILDWDYYGQVVPHYLFDGQDTPADVAAAAFAVGYSIPGGYASGVLVGAYPLGRGHMVLNTLQVLENLAVHPAAARLLLNLVNYAAGLAAS